MTREEAIEYFKFHRKIFCEDHLKICLKDSIAYQATLKEKGFYDMAIKALEQEPRKGHWIEVTNGRGGHECNICHEYAPSYRSGDDYLTKYCPDCGCRMVEPQESEDKE